MTQESRRSVLKGLGLALPAAWSRPIVEAVVLPAHAQTSTESTPLPGDPCSAPAGCYAVPDFNQFLSWPARGTGPFDAEFFSAGDCDTGVSEGTAPVVVAASVEEAQVALDCPVPPLEFTTEPAAPDGCSFFACVEDR